MHIRMAGEMVSEWGDSSGINQVIEKLQPADLALTATFGKPLWYAPPYRCYSFCHVVNVKFSHSAAKQIE